MAWDTEGTKRKIMEAAVSAFANRGPHATTIEQIATSAGVNKERIYNYFGNKQALFATVLRNELAKVAIAVPVSSFDEEDVGDYAARVFDYHRGHPELNRLLRWEGLMSDTEVPDEELRREYYGYKTTAIEHGQQQGLITREVDADHLAFLILALAGWWAAVPQVAYMLTGSNTEKEMQRRRTSVIRAARRLAGQP